MKGWRMSSNADISRVNAVRCQVYTRSADISPNRWRKDMRPVTKLYPGNLMKQCKPFCHVCSPDIAIPATEYIALQRYLISRLSMSSRITKDRRRSCKNRLSRLTVSRNREAMRQRKRNQNRITSVTFSARSLGRTYYSSLADAKHTKQPYLLSNLYQEERGYITTAGNSSMSGST